MEIKILFNVLENFEPFVSSKEEAIRLLKHFVNVVGPMIVSNPVYSNYCALLLESEKGIIVNCVAHNERAV